MPKPPTILYGKQTNLLFPPPNYQQPAVQAAVDAHRIEDEPEEVVNSGKDLTDKIFFQVRWSSGDLTWQTKEDMIGLKSIVRSYYEKHLELQMPREFQDKDDAPEDIDESTQANVRLAIKRLGVREDDPQYYDSENESDADAVEPSEAADSDSDLVTQVAAGLTIREFDKYNADTAKSHSIVAITREQFISTAGNDFCEELHEQTDTQDLCTFTVDGIVDCLPKLNNSEISQQINRERTGHTVKGLIITLWLIVCLKAHNNMGITPYVLAHKKCAVLRRTAVDIAHDTEQGDLSKKMLEISLAYWERRDGDDRLQQKLVNLLEVDGLTAISDYCLQLDLEAGRSPLIRFERREHTLSRIRRMFGSMDPSLLRAYVCGTVASLAEREDSEVRKELQFIAARDEVTPGVYANFFTDHSGMALTPAQLRVIMCSMRRYLNLDPSTHDLHWIWRIDRLHFPKKDWERLHVNRALRRYTDWRPEDPKHPNRSFRRDDNRRAVLFHFIKEVEKLITDSETAGWLHTPCARPLTEVGYSKRPSHRLQNHHAKHIQSNYIMNLFHALMMDAFGRDFRLQQVILYSCWRSGQAWLSEVLLTRVLQAYTNGGKGMSHYQAGLSNWSANRYVGDEIWHRIIQEADVERRLGESFATEIEEQKQRCEEAENQKNLSRVWTGPVPRLLKGKRGEDIYELLGSISEYLLTVDEDCDADCTDTV